MNKGFTLIELLVVVLIIGILAAIALPQYTKAVERSRVAEAAQWLGDAATAQSIYYMQNNHFANTIAGTADPALNSGDITLPTTLQNWNTPIVNRATDGSSVTMALTRGGGMYENSQLILTVSDDGSVAKSCFQSAAGFADIARTAGYTNASGACAATAAVTQG